MLNRIALVLFIVVFPINAFAAEAEADSPPAPAPQPEIITRQLMNGLFSLDVPETWHIEIAEDGRGVVLSEFPGSPSTIALSAPNPEVGVEELAGYAEATARMAINSVGDGEIVGTNNNPFKGNPARAAVFKAEGPNESFFGLVGAMYFDGFSVAMLVCGPQKDFNAFIATAGAALESYELNHEQAEKKRAELSAVGKVILADLAEYP